VSEGPDPSQHRAQEEETMRRITVALLALAALAVTPSIAQAVGDHWLWAKPAEEIPAGTPVSIETSGKLTFNIFNAKAKKTANIKCNVVDRDLIENPIGGGAGIDTMTSFELVGCTGKSVCSTGAPLLLVPAGLPWSSKLVAGSPPKNGLFMEFQLQCGGAVLGTFKGMEFPTIMGFGGMKFNSGTGTLTDGSGNTMTLTGKDNLKGPSPKTKIGVI
jgi:hypothetical protein